MTNEVTKVDIEEMHYSHSEDGPIFSADFLIEVDANGQEACVRSTGLVPIDNLSSASLEDLLKLAIHDAIARCQIVQTCPEASILALAVAKSEISF